MASYEVISGDRSVLAEKITAAQTANIKIAAMNINGTLTGWANTLGVLEITEQSDSTLKREWIYYTSTSVDATTKVCTLSGVVRGIARDTSDVTSGSTGVAFSKGADVRFVTFHDLLNKKANKDRANTFTATQTIGDSVKLQFGDSDAYIYTTDGGTNLKIKDGSNTEKTLSQLAAGAGADEKLKISSDDTTSGYLADKLTGGDGITVTVINDAGDEDLDIDLDVPVVVANGGTGRTSHTEYAVIVGGTTTTAAQQSIASVGTDGQFLKSAGAGAKPVFADLTYTNKTIFRTFAASSAVGASTTAKTSTGALHSFSPNTILAGDTYRFRVAGKNTLANTGGSDLCTINIEVGGVQIFGIITSYEGTNAYWDMDVSITCLTTGGSGTFSFMASGHSQTASGDTAPTIHIQGGATGITIDTTATNAVTVNVTHGVSDAGNSLTRTFYTCERINSTAA